jgi:hypothetical protein
VLFYDKKEGENPMPIIMEKDEAHGMIDQMSPNVTGDDLLREIYVRETVEHGWADSKAGVAYVPATNYYFLSGNHREGLEAEL